MADQEVRFQDCYFSRSGELITLGNSRIERSWTISPAGLRTVRMLDKLSGRDWALSHSRESVITTESGLLELAAPEFELIGANAWVEANPISNTYLRAQLHLLGPKGLQVEKHFYLFPGVPAIRAQLALTSPQDISNLSYTQVEALGLALSGARATGVELHDLTDITNTLASVREFDLGEMRRLVGNIAFLETDGGDGIFAWKESPVPNAQL